MKLLVVALVLGALLALAHADCYVMPVTAGASHCLDPTDKTWHPINSNWRNSECYDCTCSGCCSSLSTPTNFPSECVAVLDKVNCEYIVHLKGDPSTLCPIFGAVGK